MVQTLRFPLSQGGFVLVDVPVDPKVVRAGTPADRVATATRSLQEVLEPIRNAADDTLTTLRELSSSPTRIEIQFGVRLTAEANAVLATAGAEATLQVTLVWGHGQ